MGRPSTFTLVRVLVAWLVALSLSGLVEVGEEVVENAVHVAETGHGAHASEHAEGDACPEAEHFCFGSLHNCSCCPTALATPACGTRFPSPAFQWLDVQASVADVMSVAVHDRIDRPPRA